MKSFTTKKLILTGILAGLVFAITSFTRIPSPFVKGGYYHGGDGIIYLSAFLLGPGVGALVSGIGSFLADLYLGAPAYMFATFIIKGIMGYIAGKFLYKKDGEPSKGRKALGLIIAGLWMVLGYYIYEITFLQIEWRTGLIDAAANIGQAVVGAVIFIPLSYSVARIKKI